MRSAEAAGPLLVLALVLAASVGLWALTPTETVAIDALETRARDGRITLDGEPFTGSPGTIRFEVLPQRLPVILPKAASPLLQQSTP